MLRHLLQLARDEWEEIPVVPRIKLEREPEGRTRFLTEPEQTRLLQTCEQSVNPELKVVVLLLLHTGWSQE